MDEKVPFNYREFYDVPHMIVLRRGESQILLESAFDEEIDDYSKSYKVFLLPDISEDELQRSLGRPEVESHEVSGRDSSSDCRV